MIIVDSALKQRQSRGEPIRVGMVGAGFMGRGVARQIIRAVPGMRLVAIASRRLEQALRAYQDLDIDPAAVETSGELEDCIAAGRPAVTEDWRLLCESAQIDAILEVTGSIDYAADVACTTIAAGKHIILMNAELDGTVGPLLKHRADKAGVVFTNVDGDQPGVIMNLYRFVAGIGVRPVLCGNIKGLQDPYRTPTTQADFARRWGQQPTMVTAFADGSKISFEQAIVANATGMQVARRGMLGPTVEAGTPIEEAAKLFPVEEMLEGPGIVDYVVGAAPGPGVFVLGTIEDPAQRHYLELYKLGAGPLYCFYTPYHLCHFEVPTTIARAVLFGDAAIAPLGAPHVEVVAVAKAALTRGTVLDGIGHYTIYGVCENAGTAARDALLPMGVAPGCQLLRDVAQDEVLTYADVKLPDGRLVDFLRAEQARLFAPADGAADRARRRTGETLAAQSVA
jgi:predicted homoserine dehydrogenase-like protein